MLLFAKSVCTTVQVLTSYSALIFTALKSETKGSPLKRKKRVLTQTNFASGLMLGHNASMPVRLAAALTREASGSDRYPRAHP